MSHDGISSMTVKELKHLVTSAGMSLEGCFEKELLLDLAKLGPDDEDTDHETFKLSKDGKYMAFVSTQNGSDWKKIRVVEGKIGKSAAG